MRWLQGHAFLLPCIVFTVPSQLIMRWRVRSARALPSAMHDRLQSVASLLMAPWVWTAILCTFLAGIAWILALTRFELTYAFPFTGVSFVLILLAGGFIFGEHVSLARIARNPAGRARSHRRRAALGMCTS